LVAKILHSCYMQMRTESCNSRYLYRALCADNSS